MIINAPFSSMVYTSARSALASKDPKQCELLKVDDERVCGSWSETHQ